MLLALVCVGWLLFFVFHISQSISVNHIVDRIARETESVIDELMPRRREPQYRRILEPMIAPEQEYPVLATASGYIRFIDRPTGPTGSRPAAAGEGEGEGAPRGRTFRAARRAFADDNRPPQA